MRAVMSTMMRGRKSCLYLLLDESQILLRQNGLAGEIYSDKYS